MQLQIVRNLYTRCRILVNKDLYYLYLDSISFVVRFLFYNICISVGGRGAGGLQPPSWEKNPFHSGILSERTIGNSGRKFTERLQPSPKV